MCARFAGKLAAALAVVAVGAGSVGAQPVDPYAAPPAPVVKASDDPVLAEQVALNLVARAQELLDAHVYVDAKQLAVEALLKSGKGAAADHARYIIKAANHALGIPDGQSEPVAPVPVPVPPTQARPPTPLDTPPDTSPIDDPTTRKTPTPTPLTTAPTPTPAGAIPAHSGHDAAMVHGGLEGGLLGAMLGSLFVSGDGKAATASIIGVGGAAAGAYFTPKLFDYWGDSEAKVRTIGAGSVWGGVIGAFFTDVVTGADTSAREVLLGATIGSLVGIGGGALLANQDTLTRGDVALVDTMAGIGVAGGLTLGMLMQPAQSEAYSLNAVLGGIGGIVVGLVAAPQTNTTPRRMLRVAGVAAAGGAIPFLLYAAIHDSSTNADERVTGLLSTAGLIVGAYLGFRWTTHLDEGLDIKDGATPEPVDDAPPALVGRSSDGRWGLGGLGVQPLSPALASPQQQRGMTFSVLSAAF